MKNGLVLCLSLMDYSEKLRFKHPICRIQSSQYLVSMPASGSLAWGDKANNDEIRGKQRQQICSKYTSTLFHI